VQHCCRHVDNDLDAGQMHLPMHERRPPSEFVNARDPKRHSGGSIDGRSCQPQRGCNHKLPTRVDGHALVERGVLIDQAYPQCSLGRPNGERLEAAGFPRKVGWNQGAVRGQREHEHAVVERHRTIAITAARNRCIGFILACAAL
jgi:hypothetical protein